MVNVNAIHTVCKQSHAITCWHYLRVVLCALLIVPCSALPEMSLALSVVAFLALSTGFASAITVSPQPSASAPLHVNGTVAAPIQLFCATTTSFWCDVSFKAPGRFFVYFVQQPTSGIGLVAQSFADGRDLFQTVFFGYSPDAYYSGCCSGSNCLWPQPVRWAYADVSKCAASPSGAYLVFDVSAPGSAVIVTNPSGRGPQLEEDIV